MPEQSNGGIRYRVVFSQRIQQALKRLQWQAGIEGRGEALLDAFKQAAEQLERRPLRFGEPLYRLSALRVQVRSAAVRPLHVSFGVFKDRPIVVISEVKLLPRR